MTTEKLQELLQSDSLTLKQCIDIIYELKNDCRNMLYMDPYKACFYNGEMSAFYICLDLLSKIQEDK